MTFRSANDLYVGQDLRTQLMYAEREVVELEKETKKLKEEKDFLEFRITLLEKQLTNKDKYVAESKYIDKGKFYALKHAEKILNEK